MLKNLFKKENVLDFSCQSCGKCCKFFSVNITHLDIKRILENRPDLQVSDFVDFKPSTDKNDNEAFISTSGKKELILKKKSKKNNECVFLENNKCSIHSFKPLVCRVWPFSLEKDKIMWIKDHLSFIKNDCKHIMVEGSNNPDDLRVLIKEHYKERKVFSKLVENWNKEKEQEINKDEFFYNILDIDFINFILKEIEINKAIEISNQEDLLLENILKFLISNRRIELILESKFSNIFENYQKTDFNFLIYTKEENIYSFLNQEFLDKIKGNFDIKNIFINGEKIYFKNNESRIVIFNFKAIHKLEILPFDTLILYNPYKLEINISEKEIFRENTLEKIYSHILNYLDLFIDYYEKKEYINCYLILNKILNNLYSLITMNNYKYFDLNNIKYLNNKSDDLENFFSNIQIDISDKSLIEYLIQLIDIFKKNFYLIKDFKDLELLENRIIGFNK